MQAIILIKVLQKHALIPDFPPKIAPQIPVPRKLILSVVVRVTPNRRAISPPLPLTEIVSHALSARSHDVGLALIVSLSCRPRPTSSVDAAALFRSRGGKQDQRRENARARVEEDPSASISNLRHGIRWAQA